MSSTNYPEKGSDLESGVPTTTQHDYATAAALNGAPLDRQQTIMMPAFGGAFQPAPYKQSFRKFANPAPLGLCAFALTTFVLSLINAQAHDVTVPAVVVGLAYAYGGFVQLLAGMWEMAVGNTFGATALSSYGAFWIAWAIIQTDGFGIVSKYDGDKADLNYAVGFFLAGWFIFTFMCLLCTFKSTLAFFALFFFLDITFLLLTIAHFKLEDGHVHVGLNKAAGIFGLITAFIAWWNALAGMLEKSNSFFTVPVMHFPWSEKVKAEKANTD
ncbi:GPR1/FUN34/yaaH family-domain-containing protein [Pyronema domesticum]|uniref:Similar to Accumulation of dyads protein 2 acc. no. P25613 n=1 Tax=Pyronema omphalodes (strain CBS 100304) TaxID=1076935 RepID=U4LU72_PYROM|nr:GPR1/FUN34/yaaH family-domain-containing protein [Pyronema domesticum]CCX31406.1 Similar to Accumulation of dyads protein 2; acc. no. P25613 [Pyronema omphalodes CBS 100304]